jgi:hypothetical protein
MSYDQLSLVTVNTPGENVHDKTSVPEKNKFPIPPALREWEEWKGGRCKVNAWSDSAERVLVVNKHPLTFEDEDRRNSSHLPCPAAESSFAQQ